MAKAKVKKEIVEAAALLKELMIENLTFVAESMIDQIMRNYKKLTPSKRYDSIKDLNAKGMKEYKDEMLAAMAVISAMAIENARKEIPAASKVKLSEWNESALSLGEFEKLPPKVRNRLKSQVDLLLNTQKSDLDKVIMFQFSSSLESTDSEDIIRHDIFESAEDFILGPSIDAGAGVVAARGINEARQAFFFDDEVLEEVDAFQFVNDAPETPICDDLNGKIFAADDPEFQRYTPPLHYNCKSYIIPILKGKLGDRKIERLKPSKADLDKYVQFSGEKCCTGRVMLYDIN